MNTLGTRIRILRKQRKWTLQELAKKAELSLSYLGMIEKGDKDGSIDVVNRIAEALDVAPGLLHQTDIPIEKIVEISAILQDVKDLSPSQVQAVQNMIAELRKVKA